MKLWYSKTGDRMGKPWRCRLENGKEYLCESVRSIGFCNTAKIPAEEVTEGGWCVELPEPPGSVMIGFIETAPMRPAGSKGQRRRG